VSSESLSTQVWDLHRWLKLPGGANPAGVFSIRLHLIHEVDPVPQAFVAPAGAGPGRRHRRGRWATVDHKSWPDYPPARRFADPWPKQCWPPWRATARSTASAFTRAIGSGRQGIVPRDCNRAGSSPSQLHDRGLWHPYLHPRALAAIRFRPSAPKPRLRECACRPPRSFRIDNTSRSRRPPGSPHSAGCPPSRARSSHSATLHPHCIRQLRGSKDRPPGLLLLELLLAPPSSPLDADRNA